MTLKRVSSPFIIFIFIASAGCVFSNPNTAEQSTFPSPEETALPSSPTAIPSPSSTRVYQPLPTLPTSPPTIEPSEVSYLVTLLHSSNCELPCYLGITPGKTSWADAQAILDKIGAFPDPPGVFQRDGFLDYSYFLLIGDPTMTDVTPTPYMALDYVGIIQRLEFLVGNDKVQQISSGVQTIRFPEKIAEYWSKYSLENIFKEFGPPDLVYLVIQEQSGGYGQVNVYSKLGIIIDTDGYRYGNLICPKSVKNSDDYGIDISLSITNLGYPLNIYYGRGVPLTDRTIYLPIQESLGLTPKQYYRKVITDPIGCFDVLKMTQ